MAGLLEIPCTVLHRLPRCAVLPLPYGRCTVEGLAGPRLVSLGPHGSFSLLCLHPCLWVGFSSGAAGWPLSCPHQPASDCEYASLAGLAVCRDGGPLVEPAAATRVRGAVEGPFTSAHRSSPALLLGKQMMVAELILKQKKGLGMWRLVSQVRVHLVSERKESCRTAYPHARLMQELPAMMCVTAGRPLLQRPWGCVCGPRSGSLHGR